MKIYTKIGDKGETSLIGGKRVSKADPRVEAYGTVDELISALGVIRSYNIGDEFQKAILHIQDRLMLAAAILASENVSSSTLGEKDVHYLEEEIDRMDTLLPPLKSFILPGGCLSGAYCHVARSICRRAERKSVHLIAEADANSLVVSYLNRLSDYLFTLGRLLTVKEIGNENLWLP